MNWFAENKSLNVINGTLIWNKVYYIIDAWENERGGNYWQSDELKWIG